MEKFVAAFSYFDATLSEGVVYTDGRNEEHFIIVNTLINAMLKNENESKVLSKYPSFILDCFRAFISNKRQITLDICWLQCDERIVSLLFHPLDKRDSTKMIQQRRHDDLANVVRSEIFDLFNNVKKLIIN